VKWKAPCVIVRDIFDSLLKMDLDVSEQGVWQEFATIGSLVASRLLITPDMILDASASAWWVACLTQASAR